MFSVSPSLVWLLRYHSRFIVQEAMFPQPFMCLATV